MKKTLLLMTAGILSALGVNAQNWVEPEVPTKSSEIVSGHKYRIKNVAASAENADYNSNAEGYFLAGGTAWYSWASSTVLVNENEAEPLTFTVTETEDGWVFRRTSDNKYTFISGHSPAGLTNTGEMHVDQYSQAANLHFFGIQKAGDYYRIYAAKTNTAFDIPVFDEEGNPTLFWGWKENNYEGEYSNVTWAVYGTVSPEEGFGCDWEFIDYTPYEARLALYNKLYEAVGSMYFSDNIVLDAVDAADKVYISENASVEALEQATNSIIRALATAKANALLSGATIDTPVNATSLIKNANFDAGNINPWVCTFVNGQTSTNIGYQGASYNGKSWTNEDGETYTATLNKFIDAWANNNDNSGKSNFNPNYDFPALGDGKLYQIMYGLPAGLYKLTCNANAYQQAKAEQNPVTGVQLYAIAGQNDMFTTMATGNGVPEHFELKFEHSGGDVELGIRTVNSNANWIAADDFKLEYYGPLPNQVVCVDNLYYLIKQSSDEDRVCKLLWNSNYRAQLSGTVTVPSSISIAGVTYHVDEIESGTFDGCSNISKIIISEGITSLPSGMLRNCSSLTTISLPSTLEKVGEYVGDNIIGMNTPLKQVDVADINILLKSPIIYSLYNSSAMEFESSKGEYTYPVLRSGIKLLENGELVEHLVIPEGTTSIPMAAFYACSEIKHVSFPQSLNSIGSYAFGYCTSLKSAEMPDEVEDVGYQAFVCCYSLASVSLPEGLKNLGSVAFQDCRNLVEVNNHSKVPQELSSPAFSFYGNLYVPYGTIDAYKNSEYWNKFTIIEKFKTDVVSLSLDKESCNLYVGDEESLNATVYPDDAYNKNVTWISNNPIVVSVDENGKVTALRKGNAIITAISNDNAEIKATCSVSVMIDTFILNDEEDFANRDEEIYNHITYTRTFNNTNWQALYVPFSMNYEDWADEYEMARLNDVHQFDDDEDGDVDRTELEVIKMKGGSTEPNTPYVIKAKKTGEKTLTLNNTTLYATEENSIDCSSVGTLYTFTGTYHTIPGSEMMTRGYYAFGGGSLIQAASEASNLGAFRWYLAITDRNGTAKAPKKINVRVNGEDTETGILSVENERADDVVYDMNGRKVMGKNLKPGVYVRNGKKFVVR